MDSFQQDLKLAFEMQNAGRVSEAEALCWRLWQLQPQNAQLLFLLGIVLHKSGRYDEAVKWLSESTKYQPQWARVFSGLGCAYQGLKEHAKAANAFEKAMELEPPSAGTCYNLGNSYYQLDRVEEAAVLFRKAVELNPGDTAYWNNLGKCLKELNQLEESIAAYNRALEIDSHYPNARYGRATALLAAGRLLEGFPDYEWRRQLRLPRSFEQPMWNGQSVPGQTLFLHAEQGYGDAIQMLRFLPLVRERVGRIILECRPEIESLFQYTKCADEVVPFGAAIPPFDCFLPLASLPRILGATFDNIPGRTPYLLVPPARELPPMAAGGLKVGLVWAGSPDHGQDFARSIPLNALMPVLQILGVSFYSLQKMVPDKDLACLNSVSDRMYSKLSMIDFLDTAAIVAGLDLIITVDTAMAHLAGALGKPVWVLLQFSPDWRWLLDRSDSPWYPTARLFRQTERSRWGPPIQRVAEALRQLAGAGAGTKA